jgi:hypothetical protein
VAISGVFVCYLTEAEICLLLQLSKFTFVGYTPLVLCQERLVQNFHKHSIQLPLFASAQNKKFPHATLSAMVFSVITEPLFSPLPEYT